jgi:hypothetical protein
LASPDPELIEILACPRTRTALRYDPSAEELVSEEAGLAYPVRDGIPVLVEEEARPIGRGASRDWRLADPDIEEPLDRDGYAIIRGFIDEEGVRRLLELFERERSPVHARAFAASMMSEDQAYRAAVDRGIKEVLAPRVSRALPGYRHCFSNFLVKAPAGSDDPRLGLVPLHQDTQMVDETRTRTLGLWVPLVDTNEENGCFAAVPGSHRLLSGCRWMDAPFRCPELTAVLRPYLRSLPIKAGDAILFSQALVHASGPNRTGTPRVAAGALLAPEGAQLLCYYRAPERPERLEVYAVDDLFYGRYAYAGRPEGVELLGTMDLEPPRIDEDRLAAITRLGR